MLGEVVVAGVQPTGRLHLGSYFGLVAPFLRAQAADVWPESGRAIARRHLLVADMHAVTAGVLPDRGAGVGIARTLLACGVDPGRTFLFRQSAVPGHAQLLWRLLPLFSVRRLSRMIQWREKSARLGENAALLVYPVLQAADILLYGGSLVPAGPDQAQHVELAAEAARRLGGSIGNGGGMTNGGGIDNGGALTDGEGLDNGGTINYGGAMGNGPSMEIGGTISNRWLHAHLPKPVRIEGARVADLRRPDAKMSKSGGGAGALFLDDAPEVVERKVRAALTDSLPGVHRDADARPALTSLLDLYALVGGRETTWPTMPAFKQSLSDAINAFLAPIRAALARISESDAEAALHSGAVSSRAVASDRLPLLLGSLSDALPTAYSQLLDTPPPDMARGGSLITPQL